MSRAVCLVVGISLLLLSSGCGPAFHYRPANTLPKGTVEIGGGVGGGLRFEDGDFGGMELQGWVRSGAGPRVEVGGRFWTYSLASFGGAFELRIQLVKGPFDLTLDTGALVGLCCGLGADTIALAANAGFDGGLSIGKRFGGERGPAFYFSPHVQVSWIFPPDPSWPIQLFLPIGVDIPILKGPVALRPEFMVVGLFPKEGRNTWRAALGIGLALQGPSPKRMKERRQKLKKAKEEEAREGLDEETDLPAEGPGTDNGGGETPLGV